MHSSASSVLQLNRTEAAAGVAGSKRTWIAPSKLVRHPIVQTGVAMVGALGLSAALAHLFQPNLAWTLWASQLMLVAAGLLLLRWGIGLGSAWAGIGGVAFGWHPLMMTASIQGRWTGIALVFLLLLTTVLRSLQRGRVHFAILLGILCGMVSANLWVALVLLGMGGYQICQSVRNQRQIDRKHLLELFAWIGAGALGVALTQHVGFMGGLSRWLAGADAVEWTDLGPGGWFDRGGLLRARLSSLPGDVGRVVNLGYWGMTWVVLGLLTIPTLHRDSYGAARRFGFAVIAAGLLAVWSLSGALSFHSQLTRLFAVITVERQYTAETQHGVGLVAGVAFAIPVVLFFSIRQALDQHRNSPIPWLFASLVVMAWWSVSPADLRLAETLNANNALGFGRAWIALACAVALTLGCQRAAVLLRHRWQAVLATVIVVGLVGFDFRPSTTVVANVDVSGTNPLEQHITSP